MLAAALAKYLATAGVLTFDPDGVTGDTFIATMPDLPHEAVAITPSGGNPQPTLLAFDEPTVQVRVRSSRFDPRPGYERARAIYEALAGLDLILLDAGGADEVFLHSCTPIQSDPAPIGVDDNDRPEWVVNFACVTSAPSAHRT